MPSLQLAFSVDADTYLQLINEAKVAGMTLPAYMRTIVGSRPLQQGRPAANSEAREQDMLNEYRRLQNRVTSFTSSAMDVPSGLATRLRVLREKLISSGVLGADGLRMEASGAASRGDLEYTEKDYAEFQRVRNECEAWEVKLWLQQHPGFDPKVFRKPTAKPARKPAKK